MSSILDHVEQSVPRATVYGAMKGSPVFIGKYFREINPSSNQTEYNYRSGEKRISFVVASPDKTVFHDMRSCYLRCKINCMKADKTKHECSVAEPASNIIERLVIKMNGTVVEDISRFDHLTSFFKRKLLTRQQKNARNREGWDYIPLANAPSGDTPLVSSNTNNKSKQGKTGAGAITGKREGIVKNCCLSNNEDELCLKLDMSGIMNLQQLLSGYYSPLEIELYLQDPALCGVRAGALNTEPSPNTWKCDQIVVENPRLCIDQIVMSPEYVSAFEAALLANSAAQGIQIPFQTYYNYTTDVEGNDTTFWVRKPVRYLRSVYWGAISNSGTDTDVSDQNAALFDGKRDAYQFCRITPDKLTGISCGNENAGKIYAWQLAIGTKSYRMIEDGKSAFSNVSGNQQTAENAEATADTFNESDVMFAKAVGHYNDYDTETAELDPLQRRYVNACQGLDLEFSPDNDVLASETTLNSNDIRLRLKLNAWVGKPKFRVFVFTAYQASIALFPGNETRLLIT